MDICTSIIEICKDNKWEHPQVSINAESYEQITWHDGNPNNITVDQIKAKQAELKTAFDKLQYQRDRKDAYPELGDQLDMLWHAIDAGTLDKTSDFYTSLKATKDKYPKT